MWLPSINKSLIILKIHYFLYQAGLAPTQTALPVYASTLGFSSFVVGTIYTVLPLTSVIIKPLLGALADKLKWHKGVMIASEIAILICYFSIQFIPNLEESLNNNSTTYFANSTFRPREVEDSVTFSNYQVYVLIVLLIVSWSGLSVANTLTDTICIAKSGDWSLYGKQRLWGSIGYGLSSIVIGSVIDAISSSAGMKNYQPAFYFSFVVLIIDVVTSYFFIKVEIPHKASSITMDVWKAVFQFRVILFLIWSTAVGAAMGLGWTFLYWMLETMAKDYGHGTEENVKTIEGLVNGVQTFIGEVPAFFFASWVIKKIGHTHCMTLVFLIIAVRYIGYSFLINPWFVLVFEPLQIYFGLFYSAITSYANIEAPPGTEATMQGLMNIFVEGFGVAIGSFLGGIFFQDYGGPMTFRIFGIAFVVFAIINEIIEVLYRLNSRKSVQINSGT